MTTRVSYQAEAESCLETAGLMIQEALHNRADPDWTEINYWTARAQVYATIALSAED